MHRKIKKDSSLSLIIPLYNNASTAVKQIQQAEKILRTYASTYEIILCDDKSTDMTKFVLEKAFANNKYIHYIFHKTNQGIAKSIRELYDKARYDYIILYSVDGDWEPDDIETMLKKAFESNADIVIGKRNNTNYTRYRKCISFLYNFLPYLFFGVRTYDAGSIKILRKAVLDKITIISESVFFEAEVIIKTQKMGYLVTTAPVHYYKEEQGSGKGGQLRSVFASFIDIIKLRIHLLK